MAKACVPVLWVHAQVKAGSGMQASEFHLKHFRKDLSEGRPGIISIIYEVCAWVRGRGGPGGGLEGACICTCLHVCACVWVLVSVCVSVCVCVCVCVRVRVQRGEWASSFAYLCACVSFSVRVCVCVCICVCKCASGCVSMCGFDFECL